MPLIRRPRFDMTLPPDTVGELLYRLGGVDPARVVFDPIPGTATVADLIAADNKPACELVAGTLIRVPGGFWDGVVCSYVSSQLTGWVRDRNLGITTGRRAPFHTSPDTVRVADIAFTPWDRMPERRIPKEPVPFLAPALVVDFNRRGHSLVEMARKRSNYFQAGVDVCWLFDIRKRVVFVFIPDGEPSILTERDTLRADGPLPGFSLPLREAFAELNRHG